ncbi:MAG: hypothetical protein ACYSTI_10370 [Planctomycetota bacterium]
MKKMCIYLGSSILILYSVVSGTVITWGFNSTNRPLLDIYCSKCHTLKRVFAICKSEEEWRDIIEKKINKYADLIPPAKIEQILNEIQTLRDERVHAVCQERNDYEDARNLFIDRCTICHNQNLMLYEGKTPKEWKEAVERMFAEAMGDISVEDAGKIAKFLCGRAEILREDAGAKLLVEKCMNCHPLEKIFQKPHDRTGWKKIVKEMQKKSDQSSKASRFNFKEAHLIVDMLVKVQSSPPGGDLRMEQRKAFRPVRNTKLSRTDSILKGGER